jgi:hypothetical protein
VLDSLDMPAGVLGGPALHSGASRPILALALALAAVASAAIGGGSHVSGARAGPVR